MSEDHDDTGTNAIDIKLVGKLFAARTGAGLEISHVCRELGLTLQEYCSIERGTTRVSAEIVSQMSRLTEMPIQWFFRFEEECHSETESDLESRFEDPGALLKKRTPEPLKILMSELESTRIYADRTPERETEA